MAERDDCIADILKAIKDRRDRKFVQDHLDELDERASNDSSGSYREALGRAAEEMLKEQAVQSAIRRRNMQMDALKARDLRTFVEHAAALEGGSYQLGIEARLVGVNRQFFDPKSRRGNQQSAAAIGLGAQKDWIGGAVLDMERAGRDDPKLAGLDKLFYSKAIEDESSSSATSSRSAIAATRARPSNPQALAIAKILQKWDKVRVDALNRGRLDLRLCRLRHQDVPRSGPHAQSRPAAASARASSSAIARPGRQDAAAGSTPSAPSARPRTPTRSSPRCTAAWSPAITSR
jgi:hypothetical protein